MSIASKYHIKYDRGDTATILNRLLFNLTEVFLIKFTGHQTTSPNLKH